MKPIIICLTPVKNEAWILERFLTAVSLWADHIIIADQMSTDGSREIAQKFSKVILIDNNSVEFNEPERQKLLISEARKFDGPKLLIAIDADEIFTPNILCSEEWKNALNAKPGTIIKFQWANIGSDFKTMWYGDYFPWGYMDDGQEHTDNNKMHSGRIPLPVNNLVLELKEIKLMHFQYTNWKRMQSKHRWYQVFELISYPQKSPLFIYRNYHHMYQVTNQQLIDLPNIWIDTYRNLGIDLENKIDKLIYWWDEKILDYFDQFGLEYFRKIAIWDQDWNKVSFALGKNKKYSDPRLFSDKIIQYFFKCTQKNQNKYLVIKFEKFIKKYFKY